MKPIIKNILSVTLCTSLILMSACAISRNGKDGIIQESSAADTTITSLQEIDPSYSNRDLAGTYDSSSATTIKLNNTSASVSGSGATASGNKVTISDEGVYIISGTLNDGQIIVDAEDTDKVQIVLNNATIKCSNNPAIYVIQADKVFITVPSGTTNNVSDGTSYNLAEGEDEPDAAIFSHDDLTINGAGTLNVNGNYSNAIRGKDDVVIAGPTLVINAVKHGINGKDSVGISSGNITITSGEDGIHSSNDTDEDKGWVSINGGTIKINAGDDGIHAEKQLQIIDGDINISKSYEGFEGLTVLIAGGTSNITASDDGINSAGGSDSTSTSGEFGRAGKGGGNFESNQNAFIEITGGSTTVNAGGDGIDSNGGMSVSGGTTIVNGPTNSGNGALDYAGTATITGGTFVAAGSSGMAQGFDTSSTQTSLMLTFTSVQSAGTPVTLKDSSGKAVLTFVPAKQYQTVQFSSPSLSKGSTYTIYSGGTISGDETSGLYIGKASSNSSKVTDVTLSSSAVSISSTGETVSPGFGGMGGQGMGGHGMDGNGMNGQGMGQRPDDGNFTGTPPDGTTPGAIGDPGMNQGGQMKQPVVVKSNINLFVNGKSVNLDAYNVDGYNYFKLRDLAFVVSGTEKQFSVDWDENTNLISLTSGSKYTSVGGELSVGTDKSSTSQSSRSMVSVNGAMQRFIAYNIGGNNYFKLRDLCSVFDIGVTWNESSKAVGVDTTTSYVSE